MGQNLSQPGKGEYSKSGQSRREGRGGVKEESCRERKVRGRYNHHLPIKIAFRRA